MELKFSKLVAKCVYLGLSAGYAYVLYIIILEDLEPFLYNILSKTVAIVICITLFMTYFILGMTGIIKLLKEDKHSLTQEG